MLEVSVLKLEYTGMTCSNLDCKHSPEYHHNIIGQCFHIKTGTTVLVLRFSTMEGYEIYCRECIDIIYNNLKPILDSRLWAFT